MCHTVSVVTRTMNASATIVTIAATPSNMVRSNGSRPTTGVGQWIQNPL